MNSVLSTGNLLTYRVTTGLSVGKQYDFKVRAKNVVGLSEFSQVGTFMAARVPDAPLAPIKTSSDISQITIGWIAPYNGGTPIIVYKV